CVDDPVNRVDVWGLEWEWKDVIDPALNIAQTAAERALKIGKWGTRSFGLLTAPLGDLLFPDSVGDVEQETKEYWKKRYPRTTPEDLRERH
ncbi:MAG: hypothetical protein RDU24_15515, partial [Humidesulfovibrio sp.]|uniref:hypothetical protein n=1 Tax=Humidesulfovibrio sp. TaxID=2910988 RepID=UPI0027E6F100